MARVCKTLKSKGISGYAHREHKAKKNRTKKNVKQTFDPQKLAPKIKRIEKLLNADFLKEIDGKKYIKRIVKKTIRKQIIKKADFKVYPKYRCENCEKVFTLQHDPKKDKLGNILPNVICPHCQDYAHFSNYYPVSFIWEYYIKAEYTFLRDLIKAGKIKLSDVCDL